MMRFKILLMLILLTTISFSSIADKVKEMFKENIEEFLQCPEVPKSNSIIPDKLGILESSFIAIIASLLISVFFYFIAKILNHPSAEGILSSKLSTVLSLSLLVVVVALLYSSLYEGSSGNGLFKKYYENTYTHFKSLVGEMSFFSIPLVYSVFFLYAVYNYQLPFSFGRADIFSFQLNIGPVFKPFIDLVGTLSSFYSYGMGLFTGGFLFTCYVQHSFLSILFPVGIFFRAFNSTKGFGSALIAISLSFFFLYPLLMTFNYIILLTIAPKVGVVFQNANINAITSTDAFLDISSLMGLSTSGIETLALAAFVGKISTLVLQSSGALKRLSEKLAGFSEIMDIISNLGRLFKPLAVLFFTVISLHLAIPLLGMFIDMGRIIFIFGFLLPAIDLYIILNFARDISKALDAEIDLSQFMRLI